MDSNDIGIKGSQLGYDVLTAKDYLQSFNSSWPHLKLSDTAVFSSDVAHGLGYPPFYIICSETSYFGDNGMINQNAGDSFAVSSTSLARFAGSTTPRYFIFRLNLEEDFTADIIGTSTTQTDYNNDFGFRLTKEGKDISSTDMRDFALHSGTVAPLVHQVKQVTMTNTGGLGWEYNLTHGLGYTPTAFAFIKPSTNTLGLPTDKYGYVPPPVGVAGRYYTAGANNVYVTADSTYFTAAPTVSIVVFKNPYTLETVSMTYP